MPKLIDGREVCSSSEEHRHECEARRVAALPTVAERREELAAIEKVRGKGAADALRRTVAALWELRQAAAPETEFRSVGGRG